jgi:predicted secreted hydrolase
MSAAGATRFPRAHGAHPGAVLEWWYLTSILHDEAGRRYGVQLTFFRARLGESPGPHRATAGEAVPALTSGSTAPFPAPDSPVSAWRPGDLYFAHFAVSDLTARFFQYDERAGRTGVALAGADSTDLNVWIRDWSLRRLPSGDLVATASAPCGTLSLTLHPRRSRPVAWGPDYISYKDDAGTTYSRYQSYPDLSAKGTLTPPGGGSHAVEGSGWFDHEWSDGRMEPGIEGWDWLGLRIADGRSLMLYRLRGPGGMTRHLFGGLVELDGTVRPLGGGDVHMEPGRRWTSAVSGARYPVAWRIRVGNVEEIRLEIAAALPDQELRTPKSTRVTYWEGVVEGQAIDEGGSRPVEGYLELTGYVGGGAPGRVSTSEPPGR